MGDFNIFHHMPWSSTYSIYFFVIGISSALFFFSMLSWFRQEFEPLRKSAFYVSFALMVVGGLLLIVDLSQPLRFLNMLNPSYLNFTSPLAWGGMNLLSFGAVSAAYYWMMRKNDETDSRRLAVLGSILALGLPVYTGFDLTVHQNRPVWNTPLMPILFVAMSLLSGAAVASFLAGTHEKLLAMLRRFMLWSAGAVGVMLVSLLGTTAYGGVGQELTFMFMTTGTLGTIFIGVGMLLGTAAPIALLLAPFGKQQQGMMIAAVLILVGGMALRYSILVGGQIVQTYF
ncbi:MAG: thiosulfate reductase [Betaproteobacteria bacterium CG2_30_59_46]|nr:MAG: thiosulfate reductase [Betaproteobacteria bacterium CG2_30_59_46]PIQ09780.1 MAG: thiosulfate reductase [Hydrogenophilales bacterium CG18_big_fil_WC_8_21_14_2_50_58_12]PIY00964.1 MAG: thiosulfate reductase [Hydrogenophilales bacterium CG_4_10_14_3_um_filter_58_23]PJB07553.1 MAG: thiosulfate reductase [Hydrogenophilales bacterium CG_4_9_14_3_um_filter_59_35]